MDSRGNELTTGHHGRPAIVRRSCDPCRARKIGCDRGSPCSNCVSARVECTHSPVATRGTATPKQRILISSQYERKIDDIARDIDGIKLLLGKLQLPREQPQSGGLIATGISDHELKEPPVGTSVVESNNAIPQWDHSPDIIDFVKAVVDDQDSSPNQASEYVISSLRNLVRVLEGHDESLPRLEAHIPHSQAMAPMPPLESVVAILRWAKAHKSYFRISWICKILPFEIFEETCRQVYFAVDEYTEADFIITNSFLSYVFAEHAVIHGDETSRKHCSVCRSNVGSALLRLPLFLPASMQMIAALALGCLHSIENSRASRAWTLISSALSLCQTLGYHRLNSSQDAAELTFSAQKQLFWAVYSYEAGLALRLGRSSAIHDSAITLHIAEDEPRSIKVARIQRKVYSQIYSPEALALSPVQRGEAAEQLSQELQLLVDETKADIASASSQPTERDEDPMRIVYLQCDLVCQSSLLVSILRALPPENRETSRICLDAARNVLDMHQGCMQGLSKCKDALLVTKYIIWALLHTPFVPFSIVFTNSVQALDLKDLERLEMFASSLKSEPGDTEASTHPHRLYDLLCQAARFYIDSKVSQSISTEPVGWSNSDTAFSASGFEMQPFEEGDFPMFDLGDWYNGNQQLMSLLDERIIF